MSEVVCHRIKLRNGSLSQVREWARTIRERRDEALETLRDEGVTFESAFLEQTSEGDYLIYYLRGPKLHMHSAAASSHPIDQYHRSFQRDAWVEQSQLELLVDLEREPG